MKLISIKVLNETLHSDCKDYLIRIFGIKYKLQIDGFYKIEIETSKRSIEQNSYYWNMLNILSSLIAKEYPEYTPTYLHNLLKQNILGVNTKVIKTPTGVLINDIDVKSTTELSVSEFISYIEDVRLSVIEWFGIDINEILDKDKL